MGRTCTTLPASVDTPAAARAFARESLVAEPDLLLDDVTLVVSELVTSAVLHGIGDVTLAVTADADHMVTVEVSDPSPELVDPPPAAPERPAAMLLVSRLAKRWGVRPEGPGKVVWAELVTH